MTEPSISRKLFAVTVIATSLTFIDATALNQALPVIGREFRATSSQTLWIVGAYSLMLAISLLPAGVLADRFGCRKILVVGMTLFATASMFCALAIDTSWLIAARAVQGVGGAMMITGSLALLTSATAISQRGRVIGTWTAWCAAATIVGPLLGGAFAESGWWALIFWINVLFAVIAIILLLSPAPSRSATSLKPASSRPLWLIAVVRRALVLTVLIDVAFYGLLLVFPLTLINGAGYRADQSAAAQLALVLALIAVCPTAGKWFDRRGPRLPVCAGVTFALLGILWLGMGGVGEGPGDYAVHLLVPMILIGAGMGLAIVGLSSTVMNAVSDDALGAAAAANALAARAAAAISIGLFGAVLVGNGVDLHSSADQTTDWQRPFQQSAFLAASACGIAIIGGAKLPKSKASIGKVDELMVAETREWLR